MVKHMTDLVPYNSTCQNAASVRESLAPAVPAKSPGLVPREVWSCTLPSDQNVMWSWCCCKALRKGAMYFAQSRKQSSTLFLAYCYVWGQSDKTIRGSIPSGLKPRHSPSPQEISPLRSKRKGRTLFLRSDKPSAYHAEQETLLCVAGISVLMPWSYRGNSC